MRLLRLVLGDKVLLLGGRLGVRVHLALLVCAKECEGEVWVASSKHAAEPNQFGSKMDNVTVDGSSLIIVRLGLIARA